jgi:uncharacterized protein
MGWTGRMGVRMGNMWQMGTRPTCPAYPALVAAVIALAAACTPGPPPEDKNYAARVASDRAAKDASFTSGSDSPVPAERRTELLPLAYFPIDPDYNIPGELKPSTDSSVVDMPTSAGGADKFRRAGTLQFVLKGQPLKLTAFVPAAARTVDRLFVPFNDLTSGGETYPGGRYIDLDRTATGIYEIDFNRAYHPYCVYNPTFECPIPPVENRLKVPIPAGEKLKKPHT